MGAQPASRVTRPGQKKHRGGEPWGLRLAGKMLMRRDSLASISARDCGCCDKPQKERRQHAAGAPKGSWRTLFAPITPPFYTLISVVSRPFCQLHKEKAPTLQKGEPGPCSVKRFYYSANVDVKVRVARGGDRDGELNKTAVQTKNVSRPHGRLGDPLAPRQALRFLQMSRRDSNPRLRPAN